MGKLFDSIRVYAEALTGKMFQSSGRLRIIIELNVGYKGHKVSIVPQRAARVMPA